MPVYEIIVIVFMATFIGSLFIGYPVAWLLGGLSLAFAAFGLALNGLGVDALAFGREILDRFASDALVWKKARVKVLPR